MLIYLADLIHNFYPGMNVVPMNIAYLAAYSKQHLGSEVEIVLFKYCEDLLNAIDKKQPSLVGLSNYTWNESLNNFVGRYIKEQYPNISIVMGGPNIRNDHRGIRSFLESNDFVDVYIANEGERPFTALVQKVLSGNSCESLIGRNIRDIDIPSCFSLVDAALKGQHDIGGTRCLDDIPSPYTTGVLDDFLSPEFIPIFETNRGCPYSCTYCNWGGKNNNKVATFDQERIISEMEYVAKRGVIFPHWIVADANFGILARDVEIAQSIKDIYEKYHPFLTIEIYWDKRAKGNMLKIATILKGLSNAYIAFQTFDPFVEKLIKRRNISIDSLLKVVKPLSLVSERLHTDILLGLPGETIDSHLTSLGKAYELGFDSIGGGEIRLLKGSDLETDESRNEFGIKTKYRLIQEGFGLYRGHFIAEFEESVRSTKWITEEEMVRLRMLRAIFYGAISIGELSPLTNYLKMVGINILTLFQLIIEMKDSDPLVAESINWLSEKAHSEWHETKEDAFNFYNKEENREKLLKNPVIKLNSDFLSYLMLSQDKYDAFYACIRKIINERFPSAKSTIVDDLFRICKERNYLVRCLRGSPEPYVSITLSEETIKHLVAVGYIGANNKNNNEENTLLLKIDESVSKYILNLVQTSKPMIQTLSLLRQKVPIYLSPANHGDKPFLKRGEHLEQKGEQRLITDSIL